MPKRKYSGKSRFASKGAKGALKEIRSLYTKIADLKKEMSRAAEGGKLTDNRLTSIEVHINILARLLTTLCIEKFGIHTGALKRLVHRIEKEALRDSQIMELELLYKLSNGNSKKSSLAHDKLKGDPWDQIS